MGKYSSKNSSPALIYIIIGIVLTLGVIYFIGKMTSTIATVNGRPITRSAYLREAERVGREKALAILVTRELIYQEAERQKITVTEAEINDEINKLETVVKGQNKTLNQVLKERQLTKQDLNEQIKTRKITEKIAEKYTKVSEQEVMNHITQYRSQYPQTITAVVELQVRDQLYEQKLNLVIDTLVVELRKKAKIEYK